MSKDSIEHNLLRALDKIMDKHSLNINNIDVSYRIIACIRDKTSIINDIVKKEKDEFYGQYIDNTITYQLTTTGTSST